MRINPHTLRGTAKERKYYRWLEGMPCCLSARTDAVQRAHTGKKGVGRKAPLWTVLPLQHALHLAEEAGRDSFWEQAGHDPIPWAERLFDCFEKDDREGAEALLFDMHEGANLLFLGQVFRKFAS